ncbi:Tricalbin-2 [Mucor velutinosus]|uniref:Tricalbin-2 n=1 Tax=Mucor velutinosus TaxID=708070 RepID=A0AAN7DSI9_9FUNG|nr:Tricalbin-2 [Mucor velutinosus]
MPSRFQEHFEIPQQDLFFCHRDYTDVDQDDLYRRQSLSNTIGSTTSTASINYTSSPSYSNRQCSLKRQSRVKTRRNTNGGSSSLTSSASNNSIIGWCLKAKSKIIKLRHD